MNIEDDVFKRTIVHFETLIPYGFIKNGNIYEYSKKIMNSFRVNIVIGESGLVMGRVYDLDTGDEYTNFRIGTQNGEFVNAVREAYKDILRDIKMHCFETLYFITEQANRITKKIMEVYLHEPEFIFKNSPGYGIFRNSNNRKWYALIMNIDKSKIDKNSTGEVEILNVKLSEERISMLLNRNGFYRAYHMNKKKWITILLDNTLSDEEIMEYVTISYQYAEN